MSVVAGSLPISKCHFPLATKKKHLFYISLIGLHEETFNEKIHTEAYTIKQWLRINIIEGVNCIFY